MWQKNYFSSTCYSFVITESTLPEFKKAVQSAVSDLKQNFHVDDVKIAASNIKTYYLAIVGTDKSKKITTIFLPLGAADQSPNYFFIPSTGHVVTCINITG